MSYRNPRFCYYHAALDAGSGSVVINTGTPDSTTSIERLRDLRASAVYRITPSAAESASVILDQGTANLRTNINRLLIPAGHNLHSERVRFLLKESADAATGFTNLVLSDGSSVTATQRHAAPYVIDFELNEAPLRGQLVQFLDTAQGGNPIELGEIWWTRTMQPSTGIVPRWQQDQEPNVLRSVTTGGESFNLQRGPERRVYDLEHQRISGADLALYEALVATVGVTGRPFWYEHPDSGDAIVTKQAFESTGDFTGSNATIGSVSGRTSNAISSTSIASGTTTLIHTFASEFDTTRHFASIDVKIPTTMAWLTANAHLSVLLISRSVERSNTIQFSVWELGNYFLDIDTNGTATGVWWRIFLDLDAPSFTNTADGEALDLARVDSLRCRHTATAGSQAVYWDNFQVYDREKQPRLVELLSFSKSQDSPSPSSASGPTYTVQMQMLEVLS